MTNIAFYYKIHAMDSCMMSQKRLVSNHASNSKKKSNRQQTVGDVI